MLYAVVNHDVVATFEKDVRSVAQKKDDAVRVAAPPAQDVHDVVLERVQFGPRAARFVDDAFFERAFPPRRSLSRTARLLRR